MDICCPIPAWCVSLVMWMEVMCASPVLSPLLSAREALQRFPDLAREDIKSSFWEPLERILIGAESHTRTGSRLSRVLDFCRRPFLSAAQEMQRQRWVAKTGREGEKQKQTILFAGKCTRSTYIPTTECTHTHMHTHTHSLLYLPSASIRSRVRMGGQIEI